MIESYLNSIETNRYRTNSVKAIFQRYLLPEDYQELQTQLYIRSFRKTRRCFLPGNAHLGLYSAKDYRNAFRQARALDRRLRENGGRVYRIGEIAANDKAYDAADHTTTTSWQKKYPLFYRCQTGILRCKRRQLVDGYDYSPEELTQLEKSTNLSSMNSVALN